MWTLAAVLLVALGAAGQHALFPLPARLTQKDIDAAVRHTLQGEPLPSPYAKAYEAVRPSVVRVVGLDTEASEEGKVSDDPKTEITCAPCFASFSAAGSTRGMASS